jgi:hypothetical protein
MGTAKLKLVEGLVSDDGDVQVKAGDIVTVKTLTFVSSEVCEYLARQEDAWPAACVKMMETGATVLSRIGATTLDVDFFTRKAGEILSGLEHSVSDTLNHSLDPSVSTSVTSRLSEVFGSQQRLLTEALSRSDANVTTLTQRVRAFEEAVGHALHEAMSKAVADNGAGLGLLLNQLRSDVQNLREGLYKATVNAPAIGASFEQEVESKVVRVAEERSLVWEDLRTVPGLSGQSKVGDFRLLAGAGVGVEAKNRPLTLPSAISELDAVAANRGCMVTLMLFADEHIPAGVGQLALYNGDTRIIAGISVGEIALKLAVARAQMLGHDEPGGGIDPAKAASLAEEVKTTLSGFAKLRTALNALSKDAQKANTLAADMAAALNAKVDALLDSLTQKKGDA